MSDFTKGKWTADDMGKYVFAHGFNMMICQMRGWAYLKAHYLSDDEAIEIQKANARLISAAPEMYKILCKLDKKYLLDEEMGEDIKKVLRVIDGMEGD